MNRPLQRAAALLTLAQVGLVGVFGTGLHSLFGCEHGVSRVCAEACRLTHEAVSGERHDCVFCASGRESQHGGFSTEGSAVAAIGHNCPCDGCAVCDLLALYHNAVPFDVPPLPTELAAEDRVVETHDAFVAAAIRLALSRGPPGGLTNY